MINLYEKAVLAKQSGFMKRPSRKLSPQNFLLSFFQIVFSESKSLRNLAIHAGLLAECTVSKQAFHKRIKAPFVALLEMILLTALLQKARLKPYWTKDNPALQFFRRVLTQDSTTIALDAALVEFFPGSGNKHGRNATAKIQAVIDLLSEQFCHFELSAFSKNDQAASKDILSILRPGDLVVRDLGYFVLDAIKKIIESGAFVLSRLRYGVKLFTTDGKTEINLLQELRKNKYLDIPVLLGATEKAPVRLIALPVPEKVAAERRRKARKNRDRRLNPDKTYLALLGWNILITNVPEPIWTPEQAFDVYGIRWRIEIVFKTWKSAFDLEKVPKANRFRVMAHIYAILIWVTFFHTNLWLNLSEITYREKQRSVSLFKLAQFAKQMSWVWTPMTMEKKTDELILKQIMYHCTYETRKRKCYPQAVQALS